MIECARCGGIVGPLPDGATSDMRCRCLVQGCSDIHCIYRDPSKPRGQGTNGGCRCRPRIGRIAVRINTELLH